MPPRARKAPLKVVPQGARARRQKSVRQAAESGSARELLVAMRTRLAVQIDDPNTPARDLAALTRRMWEFAKQIEALDAADKVDDIGAAAATPDEEWTAT